MSDMVAYNNFTFSQVTQDFCVLSLHSSGKNLFRSKRTTQSDFFLNTIIMICCFCLLYYSLSWSDVYLHSSLIDFHVNIVNEN